MSKNQNRIDRLLPNGKPRYVRCYDNGGETMDRYIAVFTGRYTHKTGGMHYHVSMNASPFHPQGIGMTGESRDIVDAPNGRWGGPSIGRKCHLGTRIHFDALPEDCRKLVLRIYRDLWDLPV